jgi:hypothetical protein
MDTSERELILSRKLGKANAEARRILEAALEDGYVTNNEWDAIAQAYREAITIELEGTFYQAGLSAIEALGVSVDSTALHQQAIEWARQYGYELVSKLDQTNRQLLQQSISDYFSQNLSLKDLTERIGTAFNPVRAEMIAVTETTRANVQGELAYSAELQALGVNTVSVWNTANDEIASGCPICGPNNQKVQGDGWEIPPPAHPRCRCWVSTEIRPRK